MAKDTQPRTQRAQDRPPQPAADGPQLALVALAREMDNRRAIVEMGLAAGISYDHLRAVALSVFTRTPALMQCDPVSIVRSVAEAGQLGLEPTGLMGGAYLVPRGGQCTLLVGYRGLVMLAKRSGEVARVEARVVRERDSFAYGYGLEPYLTHLPSRDADPGNYIAAYAVIVFRDGGRQFDVMTFAEIEAIRKRSSAPAAGPWVTDWPEMAKKTVLRRLLKLAPLTIQVASQLDAIDPEVRTTAPAVDTRQAELRAQLQAALEREYAQPEAPPVVVTVTTPAAAQEESGGGTGAATDGQAAAPTPAPQEAPATCGVTHEQLGVGPCKLPAGHEKAQYTVGTTTYPPQQEHEEAGGTRWTQPR